LEALDNLSPEFVTPPLKQQVNVIMSMTSYQEINVNLTKHPLVNKQRKEAKDILVFIVRTCLIQLDIQNWKKASRQYGSY
jgi:hypothetical protein